MPILQPKLEVPTTTRELPSPVLFRSAHVPAEGLYPLHRHPWGEFVYSFSGVMEVKVAGRHFLAPPQYGIWLPPGIEHVGLNRREVHHCSLYVTAAACTVLPATPCALTVNPLMRAMLDHLRQQTPTLAPSVTEQRLMQALADQLALAPCAASYLPHSDDPLLGPVLDALAADPADNRSLAEWAAVAHTTERTLVRRSQRDLGMTFAEWRQRLRIVRALPRLQAGDKVESIALDLGYGSASAFIAMFRRMMDATPDEFRKNALPQARGTKA